MKPERIIPDFSKTLIKFVKFGFSPTEESYLEKLEAFERDCEKSLIETFERLNLHGMVKTDPYSLPYKHEITVTLNGESYCNGAYEFFRVAPEIVKEILNKNEYKFRFYMFINLEEGHMGFGKMVYKFRYY